MHTAEAFSRWKNAWKLQGAAVQGRSHIASNTPCQDQFSCLQQGDVSVIALADGAGSAAHSDVGAELTTKTVCAYLSTHFDQLLATKNAIQAKSALLQEVLSALQQKAEAAQWELSSLASTLLFVAVKGEYALLGHIGDGLICCSRNRTLQAISLPSNGEFLNATTFVTSPNALSDFRLYQTPVGSFDAFCLMSDGAAESLYSRQTGTVAEMVGKVFAATTYLSLDSSAVYYEELLQDLLRPRTRDDCSLAAMARASTASALLHMDTPTFLQLLNVKRGKSSRAMRSLLAALSGAPQPLSLLEKRLHTRKKALCRRLSRLVAYDVAFHRNGRYYVR